MIRASADLAAESPIYLRIAHELRQNIGDSVYASGDRLPTEETLAKRFGARLKHGGQLISKARFLAAPWIGMLESGAWSTRAAHANAMARRLADHMPFTVTHPVEANAVFVDMDEAAYGRLRQAGWSVYRFIDGSVRFMCSWATSEASVDELVETLKAIA